MNTEQRARERQEFLDLIRDQINEQCVTIGSWYVFRILLRLLDQQLTRSGNGITKEDFSDISLVDKERVVTLFQEISEKVKNFMRSDIEGKYLFGQLLVWVASEIAGQCDNLLKVEEEFDHTMRKTDNGGTIFSRIFTWRRS